MNIQDQLLLKLWEAFDTEGLHSSLDLMTWAVERNLTVEQLDRAFDHLEEAGWAKYASGGRYGTITAKGVVHAEKTGLVSIDLIQKHDDFRRAILKKLASVFREHGRYGYLDWESILEPTEEYRRLFESSGLFLADYGWIEAESARGFKISSRGLEIATAIEEQENRAKELDRLESSSEVSPQTRGHHLEKLIGESLQSSGWQVTLNSTSPGEENDIILSKEFSYFIGSCKWFKKRVEPKAIRDLRDRVNNRPGTIGILFSVSGFTKSATESAKERMSECIILLFGKKDITDVLNGGFDQLLAEKMKAAIERKVFDFE